MTTDRYRIAKTFDALASADVQETFERYNLAPTQSAPIVHAGDEGRIVRLARWGFIPGWVTDPAELKSDHINARTDRAARSPMFGPALRHHRCLVPTTGFYEWQAQAGRQPKQPYLIRRRDHGLFAFAGLWSTWMDPAGHAMETFTILTTDANALLRPLHPRMPVILSPEAWPCWLDPHVHEARDLAPMLAAPSDQLTDPRHWETVLVSRYVNSPAHDDPHCIEPSEGDRHGDEASEPKQADQQQRLF